MTFASDLEKHAHVWLLAAAAGAEEEPLLALLSDDERERAARFGVSKKRLRYCRARTFLRQTLSRYALTAPQDCRFTSGPYGRPELVDGGGLRFNLSHVGDVVACVVTQEIACGIDIEEFKGRRYDPHLAARVLAPEERARLMRTPPSRRAAVFLEYWTLKEAYSKALGCGLSRPFDTLAFRGVPDRLSLIGMPPETRSAWRFHCWEPMSGIVASVAVAIA